MVTRSSTDVEMACSWGRTGPCFTTDELNCLWHALADLTSTHQVWTRHDPITWKDILVLLQEALSDCEIQDGRWLHSDAVSNKLCHYCPELALIIRYFVVKPPRYMNPLSDQEMSILDVQMVLDQYLRYIERPVDFDTVGSIERDLKDELASYLRCKVSVPWARILLLRQSHWVALYVAPASHAAGRQFEYFDSYGSPPDEFVCNQIAKVTNRSIITNTMRHQYDDYLCGVYCVFYIMQRIEGLDANVFSKHPISLETIQTFRKQIQQDACKK